MNIKETKRYSLNEIRNKLGRNEFPFSGITLNGSSEFHFLRPGYYAGVAMHAGGLVRSEILEIMAVSKKDRFREEDPFTERFIHDLPIQIIGRDSRFEYDLNRAPHRAIYESDKKIWGIEVWKKKLTQKERNISLSRHKEFHALMDIVSEYILKQNRHAVIFDMHSFCYQRHENLKWFEDHKPDINVGTEAVNRHLFGSIIDKLIEQLYLTRINGYPIRIAENDIFKGGYMAKRLSKKHYNRLLVMALEYKKIFMDELTGELFRDELEKLILDFSTAVKKLIASSLFTESDPISHQLLGD